MNKPTKKREVAIVNVLRVMNNITFFATKDAVEDIKEFGEVIPWIMNDQYNITVDARYDFDEVVEYIKNYG